MTLPSSPIVLITGITGFLAAHVLDAALADPAKYRVRGTLRSKAGKGEAVLQRLSDEDRKRVELIEIKDAGSSDLTEAMKDVSFVLHTASPYQLNVQDAERDLLIPARDGTLNVLRYAAKVPTVQLVGITSSFAAVTDFSKGGPNRPGFTYSEQDWNPNGWKEAIAFGGQGAFAYSASKKVAEEAAWDFKKQEKPSFEIATFNPPMIYGKTLQPGVSKGNMNTSSGTIYALISSLDAMPEDRLPLFCHARDVADAHVLALSHLPQSAGHRFLLHGDTFTWAMAVHHLATVRPELKSRLPKGWEQSDPEAKQPTSEHFAQLDTSNAKELLGMTQFRDWKTTLEECVDDLLGLEKRRGNWV